MIKLQEPTLQQLAKHYFRNNIGNDTSISSDLVEFINISLLCWTSFSFRSIEELNFGRNDRKLTLDLYDSLSVFGTDVVYVLDPWMLPEDSVEEGEVREFLPSIVYRVGVSENIDQAEIVKSFAKCNSFTTAWFTSNGNGVVSAVAISAFDQEGCIVWK